MTEHTASHVSRLHVSRAANALTGPDVRSPTEEELSSFRRAVRPNDPGIGILNTRTGRIYLAVASSVPDGDHASLAEVVLGITDIDEASALRGFVIGVDRGQWRFVNNSGLNPVGNRMEEELFNEVVATLSSALGPVR